MLHLQWRFLRFIAQYDFPGHRFSLRLWIIMLLCCFPAFNLFHGCKIMAKTVWKKKIMQRLKWLCQTKRALKIWFLKLHLKFDHVLTNLKGPLKWLKCINTPMVMVPFLLHGAAWIRTGFCQSLGLAESRLLLVLQAPDLLAQWYPICKDEDVWSEIWVLLR